MLPLCITSSDTEDQRILKSERMRIFWPIICEPEFPHAYDLHRKTENHISLIQGNFQQKVMTNFMKTQKNYILLPFCPWEQMRTFQENELLSLFSISTILLLCRI